MDSAKTSLMDTKVLEDLSFTHCILVDSSTVICWKSPFVILGVSGLFCRFYYNFDGKILLQTV